MATQTKVGGSRDGTGGGEDIDSPGTLNVASERRAVSHTLRARRTSPK